MSNFVFLIDSNKTPMTNQVPPNNADYWNTIAALHGGTLSDRDRQRLMLQGCFLETEARGRGTSYLPFPQQEEFKDSQVWDLPEDLLILIGLTVPMVAAIAEKQINEASGGGE